MKTFIAFAFLIGSIAALPIDEVSISTKDERIVTGAIVKAIESACEAIREAGLDPLYVDKEEGGYALPVPVIFNSAASVEDLSSTGLSNIVVHRMSYAAISSRLNFDIEMPFIEFGVGSSLAEATLFDNKLEVKTSGKVQIEKIRIVGQIRVSIGIISGISIRSIDITFTLGGINSDINLVIQDKDYSDKINKLIGSTIPDTLKEYRAEIDELIEIILLDLINDNLGNFRL